MAAVRNGFGLNDHVVKTTLDLVNLLATVETRVKYLQVKFVVQLVVIASPVQITVIVVTVVAIVAIVSFEHHVDTSRFAQAYH